jgi:hypothetical protein
VKSIESVYRKENGRILIEVTLSSVLQLFNTFDPAPFHEKELNTAAESYIVDIVRDFPSTTEFRIVVYLPDTLTGTKEAQEIPAAIRNHFRYRALMQDHTFRDRWRYGRFTILVGLSFLAIAIIVSQAVANHFPASPVAQLAATALEVAGWVAMWEPVTVHLYQLWPIIKQKRTYEKIAGMEIDVLPYACSVSQDAVVSCLMKE